MEIINNYKERPYVDAEISDLCNETIVNIIGMNIGSNEIIFRCKSGRVFSMTHNQQCCENVFLADIVGDNSDLINLKKINLAEEVSSKDYPAIDGHKNKSYTWTFYRIQAQENIVTLRWFGSSNGNYSEKVNFYKIKWV